MVGSKRSLFMRGSRGGTRGLDPLTVKKSQKYRVLWQYWFGIVDCTHPKCYIDLGSLADCFQRNGVVFDLTVMGMAVNLVPSFMQPHSLSIRNSGC